MSDDKKPPLPPAMQKQIDQARAIGTLAPFLGLLSRFGVGGAALKNFNSQLMDLTGQAEELASVPGRFADAFGARGWLLSESTSLTTAKEALAEAAAGNLDAAENTLAGDYEGDRLSDVGLILRHTAKFYDRVDLIQEAILLTNAERYIAAVPLILMVADGVGQDYFGKAIFSEGVDLTELNALAGHKDGLSKLIQAMCKTRKKTTNDTITFPYRNGIMHGRDLGYGNRLVTSKCWSVLTNIADVIRAREAAKTFKPAPESTLMESLASYQKTKEWGAQIEKWKPRPAQDINLDALTCGENQFADDEPEHVLVQFLRAWAANNYGEMGRMTLYYDNRSIGKRAGEIREDMEGFRLTGATILRVEDAAAAAANIETELSFRVKDREQKGSFSFRILCVADKGDIRIRTDEDARWELLASYQGWAIQKRFGR